MKLINRVREQGGETGRILVVDPYSTALNKVGYRTPKFKADGSIWVRQHRGWWEIDRAELVDTVSNFYQFYVKKRWF